jgi:hypothetical protein
VNNRKAQLELIVRSGKIYPMPYAKLDPRPTTEDRVRERREGASSNRSSAAESWRVD